MRCTDFHVFEPGLYSLNDYHSKREHLIAADQRRAALLPGIERFCAERFRSLTLAGFESNKKEAIEAYAPSFAGPDLFTLPNSFTFGSNMVFTRDEFVNGAHINEDCTGLACGFYFMIHCETGHLYSSASTKSPVKIRNAFMEFPDYGFAIKLAQQDVGLEMTWAVNELHRSIHSQNFVKGQRVSPKKARVCLFGSSIQVNKRLSSRIQQLYQPMSDKEWDLLRAKYTGGNDEYEKKRAKNLSKLKDVDVGDGGDDFFSEELVVEGEPEPLEADLLLEDDSDVEIVV